MLRSLRKNKFTNKIFRKFFKKNYILFQKSCKKWRVSGIFDATFDGIKFKYYSECDDGLADMLFYETDYIEATDLKLFRFIANKSKNVLDIGANTGLYSVISKINNNDTVLTAFEPNPSNIKRLEKNIAINNLAIKIEKKAVGNSSDDISFNIPKGNVISDTSSANIDFSESTYGGKIEWEKITVQQTTLDDLNYKGIDLIKIDVEGYEKEVFEGAKTFFQSNSPIIFCEIFLTESSKEFFNSFLKEFNYYAYISTSQGLVCMHQDIFANDGHNYIFAKGATQKIFTSFKDLEFLYKELTIH